MSLPFLRKSQSRRIIREVRPVHAVVPLALEVFPVQPVQAGRVGRA